MRRRDFLASAGLLSAGAAALTACGSAENGPDGASDGSGGSSDSGGDSSDAFPFTYHHAYGTTTIESRPKRVVTLGWGTHDSAIALGVTPVGMARATWGDNGHGLYPWTAAALRGKSTPTLINDATSVPIERVASLRPDVILAHYSGIEREVYDKLSEFAPTLAFPEQPWRITWQQQTIVTGQALGKEAEAKKLVADMKRRITKTGEEHPVLANKTFAYVYAEKPGELAVYVKGEPRVDLLRGFGMRIASGVADLKPAKNEFAATIGMENADKLNDADIVITWFNDKSHQQTIESEQIFSRIPAVRRGSYVPILDRSVGTAISTVTTLSLPWGLDRFVPQLTKAAHRVS